MCVTSQTRACLFWEGYSNTLEFNKEYILHGIVALWRPQMIFIATMDVLSPADINGKLRFSFLWHHCLPFHSLQVNREGVLSQLVKPWNKSQHSSLKKHSCHGNYERNMPKRNRGNRQHKSYTYLYYWSIKSLRFLVVTQESSNTLMCRLKN